LLDVRRNGALDQDPLHLIERDLIAGAIVKPGWLLAYVDGDGPRYALIPFSISARTPGFG